MIKIVPFEGEKLMQPINFYSRNYLLPLLSAFLLILSFPRINLGFLAWFSLLPLFFYCQRKGTSWKQCFLGGALLGFPLFLYLHAYMSLSVNFFLPPIYGYLLIIIAAVYSCLFTALFAAGFFFLLRGGKVYALSLGAPSLWVLLEKLRSAGLLGHTGGFLGYSQVDYGFILQNISLYGYWGLAFLMVLFQVIIFLAWQKAGRKLILPAVLFLLLFLCGSFLPSLFPEAQSQAFFEYVDNNAYLKARKGDYAERFGHVRPWIHRFDIKVLQDVFVNFGKDNRLTLQVSLDILNVGNLLNDSWGCYYYNALSSYDNVMPLSVASAGTTSQAPTFRLNADDIADFKAKSQLSKSLSTSSTWSMLLGFRLLF